MKQRFWVRFFLRGTDDYRALIHPPTPQILGYWATGKFASNDAHQVIQHTICCVIDVDNFGELYSILQNNFIGSPNETIELSFAEAKPNNWLPGDRFPLASWMVVLQKDLENACSKD